MTTPFAVRRSDLRCTEPNEVVPEKRLEGPDCLSGQQRASDLIVQSNDDRAMFDEVFLPHMAEAYRLAQWLTGNAYDAEDVVQDAALRAFRGAKALDAAKCAQRCILHNIFGVVGIAGQPLCQTIGFGHMRQKDFVEHCAIIVALHDQARRLLLANKI